jgi:hypothetical protein
VIKATVAAAVSVHAHIARETQIRYPDINGTQMPFAHSSSTDVCMMSIPSTVHRTQASPAPSQSNDDILQKEQPRTSEIERHKRMKEESTCICGRCGACRAVIDLMDKYM